MATRKKILNVCVTICALVIASAIIIELQSAFLNFVNIIINFVMIAGLIGMNLIYSEERKEVVKTIITMIITLVFIRVLNAAYVTLQVENFEGSIVLTALTVLSIIALVLVALVLIGYFAANATGKSVPKVITVNKVFVISSTIVLFVSLIFSCFIAKASVEFAILDVINQLATIFALLTVISAEVLIDDYRKEKDN